MAVRNIAVTDTLETFRTQFNEMTANDFGDIANLSGSISATNLVDAMNETISIATSTAGFTVRDSSSTTQLIGGGDTLSILGTTNEIEAVVSATDTVTIGLPNNVTIGNNLTVTNDLSVTNQLSVGGIQMSGNTITVSDSTVLSFGAENVTTTGSITANQFVGSGASHTFGTISISGNTISSTDSSEIDFDDRIRATGYFTNTGLGYFYEQGGYPYITSAQTGGAIQNVLIMDANLYLNTSKVILFEGSTSDANSTTLTVVDPTADRTITFPNESGTVITTGSTDAITESMIANDAIGQNELKSLTTLQILNSSGTVLKTLHGAGA